MQHSHLFSQVQLLIFNINICYKSTSAKIIRLDFSQNSAALNDMRRGIDLSEVKRSSRPPGKLKTSTLSVPWWWLVGTTTTRRFQSANIYQISIFLLKAANSLKTNTDTWGFYEAAHRLPPGRDKPPRKTKPGFYTMDFLFLDVNDDGNKPQNSPLLIKTLLPP